MKLQLKGGDNLPVAQIAQLLAPYPSPTMFELGSNNGFDTVAFLTELKLTRLVSVEADPRCIKRTAPLLQDPRFILIAAAIHDHNGTGTFHICTSINPNNIEWGPHDLGNSLRHPKEILVSAPWLVYEDVEVSYVTLDYICEMLYISVIDFLWVDIEGANREMINGGKEALKKTRYLYLEVDRQENYEGEMLFEELSAAMTKLRFGLVHRFESDCLYRNLRMGMSEKIEVI